MASIKAVDVIVRSKDKATITKASRALVLARTKVNVPVGASAEQVESLLAVKNITARVTTWASATVKQREAADNAAAKARAAKSSK